MKNCPTCGKQLDDFAAFCPECGSTLSTQNPPNPTNFQNPVNNRVSSITQGLKSKGGLDFIAIGLLLLLISSVMGFLRTILYPFVDEFIYEEILYDYELILVVDGILNFIAQTLPYIAGLVLCFLGYLKSKKNQN